MRISIDDIRRAAERNGSHWFETKTMRFFRSRLAQVGYVSEKESNVAFFVSSEQYRAVSGGLLPRRYSVRRVDLTTGNVRTVGEFQAFASGSGAHARAISCAVFGEPVTA